MSFEQSPSNHLPINDALLFREEWVDSGSNEHDFDIDQFCLHVTLPSTLPTAAGRHLSFSSRERSSDTGILSPDDETTAPETIHDGRSDPHFFEKGYDLEAKTGFKVWPGSRLILQAFLSPIDGSAFGRLKYWQKRLLNSSKPLNILELGAGIGVVGGSLAAAGGNVVMTDVSVLVKHGMSPNLVRNKNKDCKEDKCSPFLSSLHSSEHCEEISPDPISIGSGYARPTILDWYKPVCEQLSKRAYSDVDLIIASDCIFLTKIVDPMFDVLAEIFHHSSRPEEVACLLTYQRRNQMGVFITLENVLEKIDQRGWRVQCLAWRLVVVEDDGEHELYLFEISGIGNTTNDTPVCSEEKKD